jgi:hypothetical protein
MGISSYGGDPQIVATRAEIERVQAGLAGVGNLLGGEVEVTDFLTSPLKRIGLAMELPALQERIQYLLQALNAAANEYFDGEALVAKELTDLGLISAPIIAGGILGLGNDAGLFREHRVVARPVIGPNGLPMSVWRSPATSLADLGQRLSLIKGEGQVVVERFGSKFVAYIPGTQTWNPIALGNPIDFTSNLQAMKGPGLAASERGVQLALAAAGAGVGSQIYLVGHSQGGLVAANLALKDSRIKGLVTFGAPISHLAEQIKVPTVAIQHKNDIVPKLGLKANPLAQNMVTVERVMPISVPVAAILEAHEIENYTKTAELADESQEFGLKRVREQVLTGISSQNGGVNGAGANGFGEALTYKLERVD